MLVASFANYHKVFIPTLPELHLRAWVANLRQGEELTMISNSMLSLHTKFKATEDFEDFEDFHVLWERMIRHCRNDDEFGEVTLLELYRYPKTKGNPCGGLPEPATTITARRRKTKSPAQCDPVSELHRQLLGTVRVDGSTRLKCRTFDKDCCWAGFELVDHINTCFKPDSPHNPGYDHFIIFGADNESGFLVVF